MHRQHDDSRHVGQLAHALQQLQAVQPRQGEIEQQDVRAMSLDQRQGLEAVAGLGHDFHVVE
jgi:hypothetical protein